ncbi:MAG TPA: class II glutamine amidotransferase [Polyangiaceae bacterium]|jgi:glutamine amidotransferase|nr:class II glutamine amidotransferase [Polyangiaceae bacterium]
MCRLFGFRSVIPSQVHSSLLAAENALGTQSTNHPDGWGVAYYIDDCPQVMRSAEHALADQLFHRLSGVVSSETVLAHVRKATQGERSVLNCHPFQYGRWVFAHNGDIPNFSAVKETMRHHIPPRLRRFILGDTDSETIFYLLLAELERLGPLNRAHSIDELILAVRRATDLVRDLCDAQNAKPSLLTLVVTDGSSLVGMHGGKELYFSTYKKSCPERDRCASLSPECEAPTATGFVNHFILSSEPLQGFNVWEGLQAGDIIGVDARMKVVRTRLERVDSRRFLSAS